MKKHEDARNSIIKATVEIIEESDGDISNITARKISQRSGVALGLINYHFGSKENLIAVCCGKIINDMLQGLSPAVVDYNEEDGLTDCERLISFAQQTFDYIYENPAIVKVSILSDYKDYGPASNSGLTQKGFMLALRGGYSSKKKRQIAFSLASIMQAAFLTGDNAEEITGYDLSNKKLRDDFITDTVKTLLGE